MNIFYVLIRQIQSDLPEEEDEEEDSADTSSPPGEIQFDAFEHRGHLDLLSSDVRERRTEDSEHGIGMIGAALIQDYGRRSHWESGKIQSTQAEFTNWLVLSAADPELLPIVDLPPPAFWAALATSSRWAAIGEYASVLMSLPIAEAENERAFSIRKFVVGDRGARMKNDLVTARVRSRMKLQTSTH